MIPVKVEAGSGTTGVERIPLVVLTWKASELDLERQTAMPLDAARRLALALLLAAQSAQDGLRQPNGALRVPRAP